MHTNLEEAVGKDIYKEHLNSIEEMDDWDKLMLQWKGIEGYKELLEEREKRKFRRVAIPVIAVAVTIVMALVIIMLLL